MGAILHRYATVLSTGSVEHMFVSVRMQFHNHVDTQPAKRFERAMGPVYIRYQIWNVSRAQE